MKYCFGLMTFLLVLVGAAIVADSQEAASSQPSPAQDENVDRRPDQPESYDINYLYDPAGRRDPFINLLRGIKAIGSKIPKGALTVGDAKVVGITRNKEGFVAIIVGADNKARFMKTGDKLYDGQIIGIEPDKVIFRQDFTEDNPAAP